MPKVLLVEDNADNRKLLRRFAVHFGWELHEAADGFEGLGLARELRPQVILMDLNLPLVSGWEVTRQLKADPATAAIPVIGVSAHASTADEAQAREAGCDHYLAKPFDFMALKALVERLAPDA